MSMPPIRLRVVPALRAVDGRAVQLRKTSTHIQERLEPTQAQPDPEWSNLVPLDAIRGNDGRIVDVVPGDGVEVDMTDPSRPVVSMQGFGADAATRDYVLGQPWFNGQSATDVAWIGVDYSREQDLAVKVATTGNQFGLSRDRGRTWTTVDVPAGTWVRVRWFADLKRWIAVGVAGTASVLWSADGETWNQASTPEGFWTSVEYSPKANVLVAVSRGADSSLISYGMSMVSTDAGETWSLVELPWKQDWLGVTYSSTLSIFLIQGSPYVDGTNLSANNVLTSEDGFNWEVHPLNNWDHWWHSIWVRELGLFVSVANNYSIKKIMVSPDGVNWSEYAVPVDANWYDLAWSPELRILVAVATGGASARVMYSVDGRNWEVWSPSTGVPSAQSWRKIVWIPGAWFLAVGTSGTGNRVMTSAAVPDFKRASMTEGSFELANDSATRILLPNPAGAVVLFVQATSGIATGWNQGTFTAFCATEKAGAPVIMSATNGTLVAGVIGTLNGTTGDEGKVTVACNGDGYLYFENRFGDLPRTWNWKVLA